MIVRLKLWGIPPVYHILAALVSDITTSTVLRDYTHYLSYITCLQVEKKAQTMSRVLKDCLQAAVTKTGVTTTSGIGGCGVVMVTYVMSHVM